MNYLLYIRSTMGLSQSKMATLLGVSKSLIYHVEKNLRKLCARVMIKLVELYIRFEKLSGFSQMTDEQRQKEQVHIYKQVEKSILFKEKTINKIEMLKCKLKKMKRALSNCMSLNTTNCAVADNIQYGNPGKGDDLWLAVNMIHTNAMLKRCNRSVQEEIVAKIKNLEAEVFLIDEFLQKNRKCIELPVMRLKEAV